MNIDLSICIPTYKARTLLRDCLQSIYANTHALRFEIIVVDNHSQDGTAEMLRAEFPNVHLIVNDYNAGYARPNNQAIRISQGRYVLLLNPDTLVIADAFERLVRFMDVHPEIGILRLSPQCLRSRAMRASWSIRAAWMNWRMRCGVF